jgi:DnaK suppressor protein
MQRADTVNVHSKEPQIVKTDLRLARQILELQLKEAASSQVLGDSIRIHQVADPLDMTQEAAARSLAVQLLDRGSSLVRRLRSAIGRIQDGSYGICLQCDEEIAPKRLSAMPCAELCIHCQEKADGLASTKEPTTGFRSPQ